MSDTGKGELTQRQVLEVLFRAPAARAYTITALAALAMTFAVLFLNGSDVGAVMVVLFGSAALVLRWVAAPPFLVVMVAYFQLCPLGIPDLGSENPYQVRETHFHVVDVVLVMAILVYLRAQYRVFGLVHQIVPFESVLRRKGDAPTRRPSAHIRPDEIAWMVGIAGAIVLVGQGVWWLVNALELTPLDDGIPLRWADPSSLARYRREVPPGEFRPGQNRFFVILGGLLFGTLLLRLAFGYWRLRMMSATEGAMVLTDTSWAESHRERVRVERWRIWGRKKAEDAAQAAEREAQARERRAERARELREQVERKPKRGRRGERGA